MNGIVLARADVELEPIHLALLIAILFYAGLILLLPYYVYQCQKWTRACHSELVEIKKYMASLAKVWTRAHLSELVEKTETTPPPEPVKRYCPKCLREYRGGDEKYCGECGVELHPLSAGKKPASS